MRIPRTFFGLVLLAAALPAAAKAPPEPAFAGRGTVAGVVDGDTIDVDVTFRFRMRLLDCWCPESRTLDLAEKKRGLKAKADLAEVAAGQPIVFEIPLAGSSLAELLTLDRVLGNAWIRGAKESLSEMQVRTKNASTKKGLPLGK